MSQAIGRRFITDLAQQCPSVSQLDDGARERLTVLEGPKVEETQ
jgi:hypothetical protein